MSSDARTPLVIGMFIVLAGGLAGAQTASVPLYRVFLSDGTSLASFGEWARVEDRIVFSMPLRADPDASQLHLVSLPVSRIDWARTERYADGVRAGQYAASRGEDDFARLSADVTQALNEVAMIKDPAARLVVAERARRSLAEWPAAHYGYRAAEVRDLVGVLDQVLAGLRASAGLGGYDLALVATTAPPPSEPLLPRPDEGDITRQLLAASTIVDTPVERISLLQQALTSLERSAGSLPANLAARLRKAATSAIAEEQRVETAYARLRKNTLTSAVRLALQADVRNLERLRGRVAKQDEKLGRRRSDDVAALLATLDAHLDGARRLRLAYDQWLLRVDRIRAYANASHPAIAALVSAQPSLDDIRSMAGPSPQRLRPLADKLARQKRLFAALDPPAELTGTHAVFRSACELAENAARLRLDAVASGDLFRAEQASSAAAGALMLISKAKADLDAALRPPTISAASSAQ